MKKLSIIALRVFIIYLVVILGILSYLYFIPIITNHQKYNIDIVEINKMELVINDLNEQIDSLKLVQQNKNQEIIILQNNNLLKSELMKNTNKNNKSLIQKYDKISDIFSKYSIEEIEIFINHFNQ